MASKKDFTIEELKKMKEDASKEYETISEMLRQKEKEEEDRKKAELTLNKEARKKELDDAIENARKLLQKWMKDYGSYGFSGNTNESLFNLLWPSIF